MLSEPKVTVLIPAFNRAQFIGPCIESIRRQTYPHVEILVYDDGSTDRTAEIASASPSVRVVRDSINRGVGHARNRLLELCPSDYAAWQDSDDISNIHRLAHQVAVWNQSAAKNLLLYTNWRFFREPEPAGWTEQPPEDPAASHRIWTFGGAFFPVAPAREVGFCEDVTLGGVDIIWRRAMERHCEARLILRTLYYNRTHPDRIGFQKLRPENRAEKLKSDQAYRRAMKLLDAHE